VVCASATETPRLLLNSKSKFFPSGIGNEHDQVGRNIENDGSFSRMGVRSRGHRSSGPGVCFAVDDFQFRGDAPGDWRHDQQFAHAAPLGFVARVQVPANVKPYGEELKNSIRTYFCNPFSIRYLSYLSRAESR